MPPFLPDCTADATITRAPRQIRRASTRGPASASASAAEACGMVGSSAAMQALFCQIRKVAAAEVPVLLLGASGTGKELAARALHHQSKRRQHPFVAVNCGAIVPHLLQSELFGHERGAFTGATQRRIGRIEAAHGGTLMLDEIGDMPLEMQVNLLRFLQEQTIERVGSSSTMAVNVRVIAATHVDLAEAVRQRRFREDLYYRISVVCIDMPALAARGQDIETIGEHYFKRFAPAHNRSLRGFSRAAIQAMLAHPWPGNVRELVNRVQRAVIMADGRFIQPHDLGLTLAERDPGLPTLAAGRAAVERVLIRRALSHSGNQVARAAALLGVSRVTLYRLIDKHCLDTHAEARVGNVQLAANDGGSPPG